MWLSSVLNIPIYKHVYNTIVLIYVSPIFTTETQQLQMKGILADRLQMTAFKGWQQWAIKSGINGNSLIIQPAGSGKSLCLQFPAIWSKKTNVVLHLSKKTTVVISPFLEDHCCCYTFLRRPLLALHLSKKTTVTRNTEARNTNLTTFLVWWEFIPLL